MTRSLSGLLVLALGFALVALAVFNWRANGWESMVWLASFIAQLAIRVPYARRVGRNAITPGPRDVADRLLLAGALVTMMALPLLQMATGIFAFADYRLPLWAMVIGAVMQVPFLWLFWRSHADLGINWSPGLELREGHALVTAGVYARIRHPMYAALWLSALAQPLLIENWIAGSLAIPAFAALWFTRVPREEAMMREKFSADYEAYTARTGRLWPKSAG